MVTHARTGDAWAPETTAPETVLVIEDDPDVATLISQLLGDEGFHVRVASSGEEGLAVFDPSVVDLVVLDAMLPGISGLELCQAIKEQHPSPYVPLLMLTARSALQDRVRGLEAGADDYLTKPFDIAELLAHVRAMLRIRRAEVKLWHHTQELEALNAVATAVSSSLDMDQILAVALEHMVGTATATAGAVWLRDEEGTAFLLAASTGLIADQLATVRRVWRLHPHMSRAMRTGEAVQSSPEQGDDLLSHAVANLHSSIYLPLIVRGSTLGLLALGSDRANAFDPSLVKLLTTLSLTIAVAADNARLYAQTRLIADTDPVTDLFNHRYMQDAIEAELRRGGRTRRPFAIMMMDLDNFKSFNDTYGHPAGDELLRDVARMLTSVCRKTDSVGRYGGDEFVVLLPETNAEQAGALADRIQKAFAALPFHASHAPVTIGLSVGIAVYPYDSTLRHELIKAADLALYQAKKSGRGRVRVAGGSPPRDRNNDNLFAHLEGLVSVADSRTGFSRAHAEASARYATLLARQLGLPETTIRAMGIAGLIHDVGNIGIPSDLLNRGGPLTADELETVRQHVVLSEMLIEQAPYLDEVLQAVRCHHEHWDGTGYPRGLSGEQISPLGRLLNIATSYAAMRSPRPYRPALSEAEALDEIERGRGTRYDPAMVGVFIEALNNGAA
jgi:diguanylate cyclase (GGDEF)-like protein